MLRRINTKQSLEKIGKASGLVVRKLAKEMNSAIPSARSNTGRP